MKQKLIFLAVAMCMGASWSAVTGTVVDPDGNPIAGVSVYETGCTEASVLTDAAGAFVHPFDCTVAIARPVNGFLPLPEGARVDVFSISGNHIKTYILKNGRHETILQKGIFVLKVSAENFSRTFTVAGLGQPITIASDKTQNAAVLTKLNAIHAPKPLTFSKDGYAVKTLSLEDGTDKRFNFGSPIGRTFDPSAYDVRPGFNLEIAEEFDEAFDLVNKTDPVWKGCDGTWGDNHAKFVPEYATIEGGNLVLKLDDTPRAGGPSECEGENYNSGTYTGGAKDWSGTEVRTQNQSYRFGYYEVSIDPPDVADAYGFVSTMFTFHVPAQTSWREVDVEVKGDYHDGLLTNVFHNQGTTQWTGNAGRPVDKLGPAGFNSREKNTYAFEWLPDRITWWINGVEHRVYNDATDGASVAISWLNHKIMMNFWLCCGGAVGGWWGGGGGAAAEMVNYWPIFMKVDHFKFYRWDQDADYDLIACRSPSHFGCN